MLDKNQLGKIFAERTDQHKTNGLEDALDVFFHAMDEVRQALEQHRISFTVKLHPVSERGCGSYFNDRTELLYLGNISFDNSFSFSVGVTTESVDGTNKAYNIHLDKVSFRGVTGEESTEGDSPLSQLQTYLIEQGAYAATLKRKQPVDACVPKLRCLDKRG